jgi:hypothetical protein
VTPTGRALTRSLVPVICPPEAAPLAEAIVDHVELTIAATPPLVQRSLAAGLVVYDLGALPRYLRRAHALPPDRAEAYYRWWEHGPTPVHRQLARLFNQLISLACYEQPTMTDALGYRPAPWIERVRQRRLAVFSDEIKRREAQILAPDPLRPRSKQEVA